MHTPVLLKQAEEILNPRPGEFFIDGTADGGGHATAIIGRISPDGTFLGVDWDKNMIEKLSVKLGNAKSNLKNLILTQGNYADLTDILKKYNLPKADGLLIDLGFSSEQIEESGRGFSFLKNEPLIMKYNPEEDLTAADVVNKFEEKDLADIFYRFGGERYAKKIARKIVEEREEKPIKTTFDLTAVIEKSVPKNYERGRINPSTRVFQALRIFVNQELENLEKILNSLAEILKSESGRAAFISFHSLEDRLVKNEFKKLALAKKARILTKKPIRPDAEEISRNPRSRSAKLRALQIL
jgi:16S rRNA (cytosine1402-N4)-methyltransferase